MTLHKAINELLKNKLLKRLKDISLSNTPPEITSKNSPSRLEHSIGVYKLSKIILDNNKLPEEIAVAALLHDIGVAPFSHLSDLFIRVPVYGKDHEAVGGEMIRKSELTQIIKKYGMDPKLVAKIVEDKHPYSDIIHGSLGIDGIENIHNFYTTTMNGSPEIYKPEKITSSIKIKKDKIYVKLDCVKEIKKYINTRIKAYEWVWSKPLKKEATLGKALDLAYENNKIDDSFFLLSNKEAIEYLKKLDSTKEIMKILERGGNFYPILNKKIPEEGKEWFIDRKERLKLENKIGRNNDVVAIIGKKKFKKKINLEFIDQNNNKIAPDSVLNNKEIAPLQIAIYCKNKKDVPIYRKRALEVISKFLN